MTPENRALLDVVREVVMERRRQDAKWGEQNHPSIRGDENEENATWLFYGVPSSVDARKSVDSAAKRGVLTWGNILLEEFCETLDAKGDEARREELVQVAAVAIAWIQCIDRRATHA